MVRSVVYTRVPMADHKFPETTSNMSTDAETRPRKDDD